MAGTDAGLWLVAATALRCDGLKLLDVGTALTVATRYRHRRPTPG